MNSWWLILTYTWDIWILISNYFCNAPKDSGAKCNCPLPHLNTSSHEIVMHRHCVGCIQRSMRYHPHPLRLSVLQAQFPLGTPLYDWLATCPPIEQLISNCCSSSSSSSSSLVCLPTWWLNPSMPRRASDAPSPWIFPTSLAPRESEARSPHHTSRRKVDLSRCGARKHRGSCSNWTFKKNNNQCIPSWLLGLSPP